MSLGIQEKLLKILDRAIELFQEFSPAWFNKGLALSNLKNYDEALECFDKAIEYGPDEAKVWFHKGRIRFEQKNYDEALLCLNKATEHEQDLGEILIDAWTYKGRCFLVTKAECYWK